MQKFNKAYAGGIGVALAMAAIWAIESFGGVTLPPEIVNALYVAGAGLGPALGPRNKE